MTALEVLGIDGQLRLTILMRATAVGIIDDAYASIVEELIHVAVAEDRLDVLLDQRTTAAD